MKAASGYLASDGTFFESAAEAEYYEARIVLEGLLITDMNSPELFIEILEKNHEEIERFIKAANAKRGLEREWEAYEREKAESFGYTKHEDDSADDEAGEKATDPPQHEPIASRQYVPDMGRSISAKEIREQREEHGTRMRKADARRVRRRKDMATGAHSGAEKARRGNSASDTRKGTLDKV